MRTHFVLAFNLNLTIIDKETMGHVQNCMVNVFSNKAGETNISIRKDDGNA